MLPVALAQGGGGATDTKGSRRRYTSPSSSRVKKRSNKKGGLFTNTRAGVRFLLILTIAYLFHYNLSFTYQIRLLVSFAPFESSSYGSHSFSPPTVEEYDHQTDRNLTISEEEAAAAVATTTTGNQTVEEEEEITSSDGDGNETIATTEEKEDNGGESSDNHADQASSSSFADLFGVRIDRDSDGPFLELMEERKRDGWKGPPAWITNYLQWHRETRAAHEDLQNPNNLPRLLINYCSGKGGCGGLHDRLGSLPFDLYMANQTQRLLVYVWEQPTLEDFLVPPDTNSSFGGIDWTFPHKHLAQEARDIMVIGNRDDYQWEGHAAASKFWDRWVPKAIKASSRGGRIVTLTSRAHAGEWFMEDILRNLGESDLLHTTPTFGWLWRAFFQPSKGLKAYLERMKTAMNLTKPYAAVHCRVHYPELIKKTFNAQARRFRLQTVDEPTDKRDRARKDPDWNGLKMEGLGKRFAVDVGLHALQCASQLLEKQNNNATQQHDNDDDDDAAPPLYLFADNNGMVEYLSRNVSALLSPRSEDDNSEPPPLDRTDFKAMKVIGNMKNRVVSRPDISNRNYHIDMPDEEVRKTLDPEVFYATFGDLYLAMGAKCVSFGYGGFGRFAQQLNNNPCYVQHQNHIMHFYKGHAMHMTENICTEANVTAA